MIPRIASLDRMAITKEIRRANLDGSNIEDLITTGLKCPSGIALDLRRPLLDIVPGACPNTVNAPLPVGVRSPGEGIGVDTWR